VVVVVALLGEEAVAVAECVLAQRLPLPQELLTQLPWVLAVLVAQIQTLKVLLDQAQFFPPLHLTAVVVVALTQASLVRMAVLVAEKVALVPE
jgi:hypothetical protein